MLNSIEYYRRYHIYKFIQHNIEHHAYHLVSCLKHCPYIQQSIFFVKLCEESICSIVNNDVAANGDEAAGYACRLPGP